MDRLSLQVANAQRRILEALKADDWECTHCGQAFTRPDDGHGFAAVGKLKTEAARRSGESMTIVNIAFWNLCEDGTLEEDGHSLTFRTRFGNRSRLT